MEHVRKSLEAAEITVGGLARVEVEAVRPFSGPAEIELACMDVRRSAIEAKEEPEQSRGSNDEEVAEPSSSTENHRRIRCESDSGFGGAIEVTSDDDGFGDRRMPRDTE